VRRAGRVAHEKYARGIPTELACVLLRPINHGSDVLRCARISGVLGETIANVDAGDATPRQVIKHVGINLLGAIAMAADEGAAMHEQHNRRRALHCFGHEDVKVLTFVVSVANSGANGDALTRALLENFRKSLDHEIDVFDDVVAPSRAHFRHKVPQIGGNIG